MDGCPFCATYEDLPFALGGILYEDDLVSAHHYYQDEEPNYLGHLLVRYYRRADKDASRLLDVQTSAQAKP